MSKYKPRVIIDTNVLFEGITKQGGTCGLIIEACKDIGYVSELFIVTADPDDSYIVSTALACNADYLVSGDKAHVLPLKEVEGTRIITVREFFEML